MVEWWGVADGPEELAEDGVVKWIVEFDGRPFAFAQDYDPHAWDGHHFAHLPPGSRGLDQFIGEADMLGRGHGSAFGASTSGACSLPVHRLWARTHIPGMREPSAPMRRRASGSSVAR
ncbi:GNAT family N-acetyltransferase [Rubellimicrobium rubrum]|uniref:GNAT family N-acetyltransferase n=1 Tax=Rubellimicrobium rubrum TaxID=2585369 RepID=UPI003CCC478D